MNVSGACATRGVRASGQRWTQPRRNMPEARAKEELETRDLAVAVLVVGALVSHHQEDPSFLPLLLLSLFLCLIITTTTTNNNNNNNNNNITIAITMATSSTAQGGGGSFKNRKPIGEIGCCESPMAEQKH